MASNNTLRSYSIIPCFIFVELVIMSGTVLLAYYMECTDLFSVHVQGFFCNDADLMKPYPGMEESSFIPPLILYCVVAAAPTAIIFIGEVSMYVMKSTREALLAQEKTIVTGDCCYLNPLIRRIIRFIDIHQCPRLVTSYQGCLVTKEAIGDGIEHTFMQADHLGGRALENAEGAGPKLGLMGAKASRGD